MTIAPISSNIATLSKNSFKLKGRNLPKMVNTPTANAMSVADGIAQPLTATGSSMLNQTYMSAGNTIPAIAATAGKVI